MAGSGLRPSFFGAAGDAKQPGALAAQFAAVYDDRAGLYFAAEDGAGHCKILGGERIREGALMGNLNPAALLYRGTPEEITAEARKTMEIATRNHTRFCLGSGCEVAVDAPLENVHILMKAIDSPQ